MYSIETVEDWLKSTNEFIHLTAPLCEPIVAPHPHARRRKCKRAMSLPTNALGATSHRSENPKRRRLEDNETIEPGQSASQVGSESSLALKDTDTFSRPASRTSSNPSYARSPKREAPIVLKNASPPVLTESLNGLHEPPPKQVEQLGDYLATGVDSHFIPQDLKDIITNDSDVGYQVTKSADFGPFDQHSAEEISDIWGKVKTIFLNAHDCKESGRDENAWCNDVFWPLLRLAIKVHGKDRWWLQSVQSQSIEPCYLSTIAAGGPTRRKAIDRKTDYVLSYSHRHPATLELYTKLTEADRVAVSHTMDTFTRRTALFSGFEIKAASGDPIEAESQISVWSAASIRKKQELASLAGLFIEPAAMAEPMFTIVGHEHNVYYCYPRDNRVPGSNGVHVLGPDRDRFGKLATDSIRGIFRLLRLYGNVLAYGMDDDDNGYFGGVLGKILNKLAGSS